MLFKEKRKDFVKENRKRKRSFAKRTEENLRSTNNNNVVAKALKKDKRRRDEREKAQRTKEDTLDPASFTLFMGTYHDQDKPTVPIHKFTVPEDMKDGIRRSIRRAKRNKSPGVDGVHNEMLKVEVDLTAALILEIW